VTDAVPQRVQVRCMTMEADASGEVTLAEACETFVALTK